MAVVIMSLVHLGQKKATKYTEGGGWGGWMGQHSNKL